MEHKRFEDLQSAQGKFEAAMFEEEHPGALRVAIDSDLMICVSIIGSSNEMQFTERGARELIKAVQTALDLLPNYQKQSKRGGE